MGRIYADVRVKGVIVDTLASYTVLPEYLVEGVQAWLRAGQHGISHRELKDAESSDYFFRFEPL